MGLLRGGQQPTPTTTAMKEDLFLLLLLLSFLPGLAAAGQTSPVADAAEMIADFVACNSDNVINVASMPTTANRNMRSLLKASLGNGAGVRLLAWTDITSRDGQEAHQQKYYKADFDVLLVGLAEGGEETIAVLREIFLVVSSTKIRRTLLVVHGFHQTTEKLLDMIRSIASAEKVSSFFYVLHLQQGLSLGELTWYQVLTIQEQEQTVVNPLQFVEEGNYCIKETYDLHGLPVVSTSMTWAPYLTVGECDEMGHNCQDNFGASMDSFVMLARMFNFTPYSYKDPNDDWGVYQKSGPHDFTGEWAGVMGDVRKLRIQPNHMNGVPQEKSTFLIGEN